MTGQFCRAWNTCVKLVHDVPRSTHTYLVENYLSTSFIPVKTELFARYLKFVKSLKESKSLEVRYLCRIIGSDVLSTTSRNLYFIQHETGLDPSVVSSTRVRATPVVTDVPAEEVWRLPLLDQYLRKRKELLCLLEDTYVIETLINALCST